MGDFDIDISNSDHEKLDQFCTLFNLKSLIEKETCITKSHKSTADLILTNQSFQRNSVIETYLAIITNL